MPEKKQAVRLRGAGVQNLTIEAAGATWRGCAQLGSFAAFSTLGLAKQGLAEVGAPVDDSSFASQPCPGRLALSEYSECAMSSNTRRKRNINHLSSSLPAQCCGKFRVAY